MKILDENLNSPEDFIEGLSSYHFLLLSYRDFKFLLT